MDLQNYCNLIFEIILVCILFSSGKRVPLFPNSQSTFLSLENRNRFVDLAVKQRLEEMVPAANLIREGICEIVPVPILDLMPIGNY